VRTIDCPNMRKLISMKKKKMAMSLWSGLSSSLLLASYRLPLLVPKKSPMLRLKKRPGKRPSPT